MKMKKPHYIYISMLAAILLAACSKDDGDSSQPAVEEKGRSEICVKTNVSNMQSRATTIDNTTLHEYDLKIDAYYNGTNGVFLDGVMLHYDSAEPAALKWKFWDASEEEQLHYYWPFEGSKTPEGDLASTLDFVGFCPFEKPAYIGAPTYDHTTGVSFTCDMSSYMTIASQSSMQEFLVSVLNAQTLATQTAAGGAVPLVFKHPFALIKFVITAASGTHVQINNIRIGGLYTAATCTYDGTTMSWGSYDDETKATMTIAQTLKIGGTTETTPFVVIPKNYGTKTLTVNGTWDDWSAVTKDISTDISINWEPGCIYTYNLTVTPLALKVDVNKFTEQW